MRNRAALTWIFRKPFSAPIAIAAWLTVSFAAANEAVNQLASTLTLPSDPMPISQSTVPSVSSNPFVLRLPDENGTLCFTENCTTNIHFHIPDSPIDLTFTAVGSTVSFRSVFDTVSLALDEIATNVAFHPAESIMGRSFRQTHDGLEIKIYQSVDAQITWYLLHQLLLGVQYFASHKRSCELRFEIDVAGKGRVGQGSLWNIGPKASDVAKRAVNETSQHLAISSVLKPALPNSTHPLLSPILNETHITYTYHFFGPPLSELLVRTCFALAREYIRTEVELYPHNPIPYDTFQFRVGRSPISVSVEAYADKNIWWLLLDNILRDVSSDLLAERHQFESVFEFEIGPLQAPYGRGFLEYDPVASDTSRRA